MSELHQQHHTLYRFIEYFLLDLLTKNSLLLNSRADVMFHMIQPLIRSLNVQYLKMHPAAHQFLIL